MRAEGDDGGGCMGKGGRGWDGRAVGSVIMLRELD